MPPARIASPTVSSPETEAVSAIRIPVQMRWADLDAYGHVNNAAMLTLLEEARIAAFWSEDGVAGTSAETKVLGGGPASDTHTLVAHQEIEYLAPLDYSQNPVIVEVWIGKIGGASLLICYAILDPRGQVCAKAASSIVKVDAQDGAPTRFTSAEREALQPLLGDPVQFRRR